MELACTFVTIAFAAWVHAQVTPPSPVGSTAESQSAAAEQAGRLREAFQLYVAAYQALPDPAPPEAAEVELRRAARLAPWYAAIAFNLALVQEKATHYDAALANVRIYLLSSPADADQAKAKLYELELESEQTTRRQRVLPEAARYLDDLTKKVNVVGLESAKGPLGTWKPMPRARAQQRIDVWQRHLEQVRRYADECSAGTVASCDTLAEHSKGAHFEIIGLVAQPGVFTYRAGITVAQAVAQTGTTIDGQAQVRVWRSDRLKRLGWIRTREDAWKTMLEETTVHPGDAVEPGDIVEVQRAGR